MEVPIPHIAEQFVGRLVVHIVAVPVPRIWQENVQMVSLAPPGRISERTREPIEEVAVPQVAEWCVAHFVCCQATETVCVSRSMHVFLDLSLVFRTRVSQALCERQVSVGGGGVAPQTLALRVLPLTQTAQHWLRGSVFFASARIQDAPVSRHIRTTKLDHHGA